MPKFMLSFGFLLVLAVCFTAPGPKKAYSMGSKSGFEHVDKKETREKEPPRQGTEKGKATEKEMRQENSGGNQEKPLPEKKPRLKYRDPYECGC